MIVSQTEKLFVSFNSSSNGLSFAYNIVGTLTYVCVMWCYEAKSTKNTDFQGNTFFQRLDHRSHQTPDRIRIRIKLFELGMAGYGWVWLGMAGYTVPMAGYGWV